MEEKIIDLLKRLETGSIENDETISKAGFISRRQYKDVAEEIMKLFAIPDAIKPICKKSKDGKHLYEHLLRKCIFCGKPRY